MKQLLDAGAAPDIAAPGGVRPLHLACAGPITTSSTRSKICLAHFYDQQQLWKKAGPGSSDIVKLLLAAGAGPSAGSTCSAVCICPVLLPVQYLSCVRLVTLGCLVTFVDSTMCCCCLCTEILAAGADQASRTASGATGLHIAANSGSADVIADLLESSEDLDPDDDGAYNCKCHQDCLCQCPSFQYGDVCVAAFGRQR